MTVIFQLLFASPERKHFTDSNFSRDCTALHQPLQSSTHDSSVETKKKIKKITFTSRQFTWWHAKGGSDRKHPAGPFARNSIKTIPTHGRYSHTLTNTDLHNDCELRRKRVCSYVHQKGECAEKKRIDQTRNYPNPRYTHSLPVSHL